MPVSVTEHTYEDAITAGLIALKSFRDILTEYKKTANSRERHEATPEADSEFRRLETLGARLNIDIVNSAAGFADKLGIRGDLGAFVESKGLLAGLIGEKQAQVAAKGSSERQLRQAASNIVVAFRHAQELIDFVSSDESFTSVHHAAMDEFTMNLERCRKNFHGAGKDDRAPN